MVVLQVGSVAEAQAAAAAGVDAVIAQGIEAGGHVRGTTSIWELLPATVAALGELPVLASGGIGDPGAAAGGSRGVAGHMVRSQRRGLGPPGLQATDRPGQG
jgi:nitronate monooxygenase